VLLGAALVLLFVAVPRESRQAGDWVIDDSKRRLVSVALNLLPFAGIAFLWFIGVVRDRIGASEDRFFATVFLGSGLLFVAMLFAAGAIAGGLVASPDSATSDPELWMYGRRVSYSLITVYAMRMAGVFMMSTTMLALRLQLTPRWVTGFGFVGAVVLLATSGSLPLIEVVFPLWVLILSVNILLVTLRQPDVAAAPADASSAGE
jgi:hypothetical protein